MAQAEVGKQYRHYKGHEYTILSIGRLEETLEEVVIYRAEYEAEDFGAGAVWVRPKIQFEEMVEYNGEMTDRFSLIPDV